MQTGLLALAIALIIALVAAIAGPHFVDWGSYRPLFEHELSQALGARVTVTGAVDARLLPSPSVRLRGLNVESEGGLSARADSLDVEFGLGALMRGEWRATELTLRGLNAALMIGEDGQLGATAGLDLSGVSIDRMTVTGQVLIHDGASGRQFWLEDVLFSGDLRAATSSLRGEGRVVHDARSLAYRISLAPAADQAGLRAKLSIESAGNGGASPLHADAEGNLQFSDGRPRFEGQVSLSRPVALDSQGGDRLVTPWRLRAQATGGLDAMRLASLDFTYGADEGGLKLTGLADVSFGRQPRAEAVLSARQVDLDRLSATAGTPAAPGLVLSDLAQSLVSAAPGWALELHASADMVQLGGRPLRSFGVDARRDAREWAFTRIEVEAPGSARLSGSGRLSQDGSALAIRGAVDAAIGDAAALAAWLGGIEIGREVGPSINASATIDLSADRLVVDNLKGDLRGAAFTGRLDAALSRAGAKMTVASADLALDAQELDLEAAGTALAGIGLRRAALPERVTLDLRVAKAMWRERTARDVRLRGSASASELSLQTLSLSDFAGLSLEGAGQVSLADGTGRLTAHARGAAMRDVLAAIAPLTAGSAARLDRSIGAARSVDADLSIDIARDARGALQAQTSLDVTSSMIMLRGRATAGLPMELDLFAPASWPALAVTGEIDARAPETATLVALAGLDSVIAAGRGAGRMALSITGPLSGPERSPLQLKGEISGDGIAATLGGAVSFVGTRPDAGALTLDVARADIAPLAASALPVNVTLVARTELGKGAVVLRDIEGTVAGAKLRGALRIDDAFETPRLDADLALESLAVGPVAAALTGAPRAASDASWSREPFGRGAAFGWQGRLGFTAERAEWNGLVVQRLRGVARADGTRLHLDDLAGETAGGAWRGRADLTRGDALQAEASAQLDGVDATALPVVRDALRAGRLSAEISITTSGRSPAAMIGSLNGSVNVRLRDASLPRLNAAAFGDGIASADAGPRIDGARLARTVQVSLDAGDLVVPEGELALSVRAGRLFLGPVTLAAKGASLAINGSYEFISGTGEVRLKLQGSDTPQPAGAGPPVIDVALKGPAASPTRQVDTAAFMAWLTVRSVDREMRRLEQLEKARAAPSPQGAPDANAAGGAASATATPSPAAAPDDNAATPATRAASAPSPVPAIASPTAPSPPSTPRETATPPRQAAGATVIPDVPAIVQDEGFPALPESNVPLPIARPKPKPPAPIHRPAVQVAPLPPPIELLPPPGFR